jgi:hypothetical protein
MPNGALRSGATRRQMMRMSGVKKFAVLTTMILMTGCGSLSVSQCSWVERIILDDNWEERLTRAEKIQLAGHNENVLEFCR